MLGLGSGIEEIVGVCEGVRVREREKWWRGCRCGSDGLGYAEETF